MKTNALNFILVDDDAISNFITKRVIMENSPQAKVISFTEPEKGLECVLSLFKKPKEDKAILLLDINMPSMTGWEFMEILEQKEPAVSERLLVYILSSSVNPADKERAGVNLQISDYIMKPLTNDAIISILSMKVV